MAVQSNVKVLGQTWTARNDVALSKQISMVLNDIEVPKWICFTTMTWNWEGRSSETVMMLRKGVQSTRLCGWKKTENGPSLWSTGIVPEATNIDKSSLMEQELSPLTRWQIVEYCQDDGDEIIITDEK